MGVFDKFLDIMKLNDDEYDDDDFYDDDLKDKIKARDGFCECFYCHELKNIDDMVVDKRRKNGHGTCCKQCDNKRRRR